ncbi:MAG: DUF29 domain-containing protein [Geminicoccaceae bacterium]|nr:DUF29 domain-containing protein [Geminicoccaceae bacterium]
MAKVLEKPLYETDYYAWTLDQAARLRALAEQRSNLPLDLDNLAEEVESLGRSDLRTCRSQIRRIIEHLLKLEYSPATEPRRRWIHSIRDARFQLSKIMTASLRRDVQDEFEELSALALEGADVALREHGEDEAADALPEACPYDFDRVVDRNWYPVNRHGLELPATGRR